jgi:phosphohistidine phosphatase
MERLYVVRHGLALPHGTPGVPDDERPLTPPGESRMQVIGRGLRRLGVRPERILTSPLPRARRTAEILADHLGVKPVLEDDDQLRAGASPEGLAEWLRTREETRLMIVGHNPDFSDLVARLLGMNGEAGIIDLKKGGIAALAVEGENRYRLLWVATPRVFRKLSG